MTVKRFSLAVFREGLSVENQLKFAEILSVETDENKAILMLITSLKKSEVKIEKFKTPTVTNNVAGIVETIMHYNRQLKDTDVKFVAVPSYGLINQINTHLKTV